MRDSGIHPTSSSESWPALPFPEWRDTRETPSSGARSWECTLELEGEADPVSSRWKLGARKWTPGSRMDAGHRSSS